MRHLKRNGLLLGIGALGVSAVIGMAQPVSADPPPHARNERNGKGGHHDRGRDRNDRNRHDRGRHEGWRNDRDRNDRWDRDNKRGNRHDHRRDRDNRWDPRPRDPRWNNRRPVPPVIRPIPRPDYRNDPWFGGNTSYNSYTGTVVRVKSAQSFDVSIGGKTYNVYTDSRLPRGLSNRDIVRVSGNRVGSNDIRNARVVIVSNR